MTSILTLAFNINGWKIRNLKITTMTSCERKLKRKDATNLILSQSQWPYGE